MTAPERDSAASLPESEEAARVRLAHPSHHEINPPCGARDGEWACTRNPGHPADWHAVYTPRAIKGRGDFYLSAICTLKHLWAAS